MANEDTATAELAEPIGAENPMDWSLYATQYDVMCDNNPYYGDNVAALVERIPSWDLPANASICDIGAGTGNYFCHLVPMLPDGHFVHIDCNKEMNKRAAAKYAEAGIRDLEIVDEYVQRLDYTDDSFDLIICVHALYAMQPQDLILRKIRRWLKPGGQLFLIDLGRKMNLLDWSMHHVALSFKRGELMKYMRNLIKGREVIRQNRLTTLGQASGAYWLHETNEFGEILQQAGFVVEELQQCYRGYSDLAICRKANG